jgi:hypothetical protein
MPCRQTPEPARGLCGQGEGMDARVEATQERLPDARKARKRGAPLFGYFLSGKQKRSDSPSAGGRMLFAPNAETTSKGIAR